jgi:hypothetical protein
VALEVGGEGGVRAAVRSAPFAPFALAAGLVDAPVAGSVLASAFGLAAFAFDLTADLTALAFGFSAFPAFFAGLPLPGLVVPADEPDLVAAAFLPVALPPVAVGAPAFVADFFAVDPDFARDPGVATCVAGAEMSALAAWLSDMTADSSALVAVESAPSAPVSVLVGMADACSRVAAELTLVAAEVTVPDFAAVARAETGTLRAVPRAAVLLTPLGATVFAGVAAFALAAAFAAVTGFAAVAAFAGVAAFAPVTVFAAGAVFVVPAVELARPELAARAGVARTGVARAGVARAGVARAGAAGVARTGAVLAAALFVGGTDLPPIWIG